MLTVPEATWPHLCQTREGKDEMLARQKGHTKFSACFLKRTSYPLMNLFFFFFFFKQFLCQGCRRNLCLCMLSFWLPVFPGTHWKLPENGMRLPSLLLVHTLVGGREVKPLSWLRTLWLTPADFPEG